MNYSNTWPAPIICNKYRFIFMPIPKSGCSSIKSTIAVLENKLLINDDPHQTRFETISKDLVKSHYFPSFAFVRNPITRLYSCWKDKVKNHLSHELKPYGKFYSGMSFEDFVQAVSNISDEESNGHFRSQYAYLYSRGFQCPTHVAKLENSSNEWKKISDWLKIPFVSLGQRNKTRGDQIHSDFVKQFIYNRYEQDFIKFEYEVE